MVAPYVQMEATIKNDQLAQKSLKNVCNLIFYFIYMYISQPTSFYYRIKDLVMEASPAELCTTEDGQLTGPF